VVTASGRNLTANCGTGLRVHKRPQPARPDGETSPVPAWPAFDVPPSTRNSLNRCPTMNGLGNMDEWTVPNQTGVPGYEG
jgi:hypothetical protein